MASSFTAQDASKDGERGVEEGGGRNDEENECKGIRRRRRWRGEGGEGRG